MNTLILIVTIVLIVGLNMFITNKSRKYMNTLIEQQTSNPNEALRKLNKWHSKLLIPYYQRTVMYINCYSLLDDKEHLIAKFNEFNTKSQSKRSLATVRDKAMIYQKEISYYIHQNDSNNAKVVNGLLQDLKDQTKDQFTLSLINESNDCIQIYLDHNFAYIDKGKQTINDSDNNVFKGIWHYRLAYLYHIKNVTKETTTHLTKAHSLLKDSELYPLVNEVTKNHQLIETTIL